MDVRRLGSIALGALLVGACSSEPAPATIGEWDLFVDASAQTPTAGLVPYELVAPLFSDYAAKHRFMRLPEGGQITVTADGRWEFPLGTVLVKTFGFLNDMRDPSLGERIVETRLLVLEDEGWEPYVYVWNADVSEAVLTPAGRRVPVEFVDLAGETVSFDYRVPSHTQCGNCHGGDEPILPLGPRTAQMDRDGQLEALVALGMLPAMPAQGAPLVDPADEAEALDARARSYLHANCSHCHRENGPADQSGLLLEIENTRVDELGYCKIVVAAGRAAGGRSVVIHPGDPDDSVMLYRMRSTEAGVRMPDLPSVLTHVEGADLIESWIGSLPWQSCGLDRPPPGM